MKICGGLDHLIPGGKAGALLHETVQKRVVIDETVGIPVYKDSAGVAKALKGLETGIGLHEGIVKDLHQQVLHFLGVVHILKSHINLPDCRRTSEPVPPRTYATRAGRQPYGDGCTRSSGRPCRGPARRC